MGVFDPRPLGLVLAGGLARRMDGVDKTLLRLGPDTSLLRSLLERIAPQCGGLAISANGDPGRFAGYELPVVGDAPGPARGPLAGVLTGLEISVPRSTSEWLLTVPGDTPFVPADLVIRLAAAAQRSGHPIARATCNGRLHSLVALWSSRLRDPLREALITRDHRKVTAFQADVGVADVQWPAVPYDPFFNVNTPGDLETARRLHREFGE